MSKIVVLDSGHGGRDPGAASNGIQEKHPNLTIALSCRDELNKYDCIVKMTRTTDTYVALSNRPTLGKGADLFVSIHNNASSSTSARGFETFCYSGTVLPATLNNRNILHDTVYPYLKSLGVPDRGKKRYNHYITRVPPCSTVLLEYLFVTNANDAALLKKAAVLKELGRLTAVGIAKALGLKLKAPPQDTVVYRIIVNGKQAIALTGFEKAKNYALKTYPNDEIILQNTKTNEKIKVQDAKPKPKPPAPEPPKEDTVVYRVIINGKQVIALTGFEKAKEYALATYPNDEIILQNVDTNEKIKIQDAKPKPEPIPVPEPAPEPKPEYKYNLIGKSEATLEQAKQWAKDKGAHQRFIDIADIYWKYGEITEIRSDILYCQAAHETNFGKYTGNVVPDQNNWAGIKIKNPTGDKREDHEIFASPEDGVRGHFNHMAAYVGVSPVGEPHGRYYVAIGQPWAGLVKHLEGLSGKWAPSTTYHTKIVQFLKEMLVTEAEPEPNIFLELLRLIFKAIADWINKIKGGK